MNMISICVNFVLRLYGNGRTTVASERRRVFKPSVERLEPRDNPSALMPMHTESLSIVSNSSEAFTSSYSSYADGSSFDSSHDNKAGSETVKSSFSDVDAQGNQTAGTSTQQSSLSDEFFSSGWYSPNGWGDYSSRETVKKVSDSMQSGSYRNSDGSYGNWSFSDHLTSTDRWSGEDWYGSYGNGNYSQDSLTVQEQVVGFHYDVAANGAFTAASFGLNLDHSETNYFSWSDSTYGTAMYNSNVVNQAQNTWWSTSYGNPDGSRGYAYGYGQSNLNDNTYSGSYDRWDGSISWYFGENLTTRDYGWAYAYDVSRGGNTSIASASEGRVYTDYVYMNFAQDPSGNQTGYSTDSWHLTASSSVSASYANRDGSHGYGSLYEWSDENARQTDTYRNRIDGSSDGASSYQHQLTGGTNVISYTVGATLPYVPVNRGVEVGGSYALSYGNYDSGLVSELFKIKDAQDRMYHSLFLPI